VRAWQQHTIAQARKFGHTRTLMGRYRPLPGVAPSNPRYVRSHAERAAINTPIQVSVSASASVSEIEGEGAAAVFGVLFTRVPFGGLNGCTSRCLRMQKQRGLAAGPDLKLFAIFVKLQLYV
jgi:hypothetical protein